VRSHLNRLRRPLMHFPDSCSAPEDRFSWGGGEHASSVDVQAPYYTCWRDGLISPTTRL